MKRDLERDLERGSFARRSGGELGKQSEDPSFLLIEGIKERSHVDESVCHLQDSSFQVSLGREGAMPMWMGMDGLATKSREVPSIQTLDCQILVDQTPWCRTETLNPHQHQNECGRELDCRASQTYALLLFDSAARAISEFFMASRSDLCHRHLTLIYS